MSESSKQKMYPPPGPVGRVFRTDQRSDALPTCGMDACPQLGTCSADPTVAPQNYLGLCLPEIRARIAPPIVGGEIRRVHMRCVRCMRWQSVHPDHRLTASCGSCGSDALSAISMEEHMASVPKAPRELEELQLPPGSPLVKTE